MAEMKMNWNERLRLAIGAVLLAAALFALLAGAGPGVRPGLHGAAAAGAGGGAMTDLLREIAKLPQVQGALSVELLAGEPSRRFYLLRASVRPGADLAVLQGDETEGYARLLSGAPAMLDLLAVLLLRWGEAVEQVGQNPGRT